MPRTSYPVDKELLLKSFIEAEKEGALKNRSELFSVVAERYNENSDKKINSSHVRNRVVKDWGRENEEGILFIEDYAIKTPKGRRGKTSSLRIAKALVSENVEEDEEEASDEEETVISYEKDVLYMDYSITSFHAKFLQLKAVQEGLEKNFYVEKYRK